MKSFIIVVIQITGVAFIIACVLSLLNYFFGWRLGMYDAEVPSEPEFAVIILVLGLILSGLGYFLDKKISS
ncbi:MAG: hypothetical protein R2681_02275 [Pyrinomonadaceae bacterium]